MDYFLFETTGNLNDESLCLIEDCPEGLEKKDYTLQLGQPCLPYFPESAVIRLREENRGIKLTHIIGNTKSYFIGSKLVKEIIELHCPNQNIEYLPFTLYNHKSRVHSTDYFIINPIGGFDCLNLAASGAVYSNKDGRLLTLKNYVLDTNKIKKAPHLFRIDVESYNYVVSEALAQAFVDGGVTNFNATEMDVA